MTESAVATENTCRLFLDGAAAGGWNMAADELLLEQASDTGQASLRIYSWSEPTLSLGYFQSHADRQTHAPSRDCRLVRRRSGGGAILHEHEITYALAIPSKRVGGPMQKRWFGPCTRPRFGDSVKSVAQRNCMRERLRTRSSSAFSAAHGAT